MSIVREITIEAKKYLKTDEFLIFVGARQAGKTTILKQLQAKLIEDNQETYFLNLEDLEYVALLNKTPKNIFKIFPINLKKKNYIFVDEIQYLDNPSNFLKYLYDEYKNKIKIIASGSSAFYIDKKFKDSLVGRKKIFNVSTLSFSEFLTFKEEKIPNFQKMTLSEREKIAKLYEEYMIYGGYPRVVLAKQDEKVEILREIAFSYVKKDALEANIAKPEIFYKMLKILAFQTGNLFNSLHLANTLGVSKTAIDNYFYVMQKSFHIAQLKPFYRNIKKEITKMPKIYFLDTGLRNFFVNDFTSFINRQDKGELLENSVFRQYRKYFEKDNLKYWRTIGKNEVDFVINEKRAVEVKANVENFRISKYKKFMELYPNIKLHIVTFAKKEDRHLGVNVFDAWEIE